MMRRVKEKKWFLDGWSPITMKVSFYSIFWTKCRISSKYFLQYSNFSLLYFPKVLILTLFHPKLSNWLAMAFSKSDNILSFKTSLQSWYRYEQELLQSQARRERVLTGSPIVNSLGILKIEMENVVSLDCKLKESETPHSTSF